MTFEMHLSVFVVALVNKSTGCLTPRAISGIAARSLTLPALSDGTTAAHNSTWMVYSGVIKHAFSLVLSMPKETITKITITNPPVCHLRSFVLPV